MCIRDRIDRCHNSLMRVDHPNDLAANNVPHVNLACIVSSSLSCCNLRGCAAGLPVITESLIGDKRRISSTCCCNWQKMGTHMCVITCTECSAPVLPKATGIICSSSKAYVGLLDFTTGMLCQHVSFCGNAHAAMFKTTEATNALQARVRPSVPHFQTYERTILRATSHNSVICHQSTLQLELPVHMAAIICKDSTSLRVYKTHCAICASCRHI